MSWDAVTLAVIGTASLATLLLSQIRDILIKTSEIIQAWHQLRGVVSQEEKRSTECINPVADVASDLPSSERAPR
ncbi:hypothetical protein Hesp01_47100 [Herbidospora sp. NBRC 101105]|nr:hypothetical protein Hesp01_47100 [Herbidospora sp. NBRC 101105]